MKSQNGLLIAIPAKRHSNQMKKYTAVLSDNHYFKNMFYCLLFDNMCSSRQSPSQQWYCTREPLTCHVCQLVDRLLVVLFLILHRFIRRNNNSEAGIPYVTNPHLIPHHSAVTRQIVQTMEDGLGPGTHRGAATVSGLQTDPVFTCKSKP